MTYSQKIARAFEIAGYLLLAPAIFGALMATLVFSGFTLIIYSIFIFGCVLLGGYFKHSRGRLDEEKIRSLWLATAAYNAILLLPVLAFLWAQFGWQMNSHGEWWKSLAISLCIAFGYMTAIVLAIKAYLFEKNGQKYL